MGGGKNSRIPHVFKVWGQFHLDVEYRRKVAFWVFRIENLVEWSWQAESGCGTVIGRMIPLALKLLSQT